MKSPALSRLLQSEEVHMERVYKKFDEEIGKHKDNIQRCRQLVSFGEAQDEFMGHSALSVAKNRQLSSESYIRGLYKRPYFAHVAIREDQTDEVTNCFLSDCESLNTSKMILDQDYVGILIPFKQDPRLPISVAMFHCYQAGNGEPVQVKERDGRLRKYTTELICDDEIENRKLLSVSQRYPAAVEYAIDADELLEEKLKNNRDDPMFRNIISTLQRQQFDIIGADYQASFVVQGCAGSGKSQCLLHRLFFLRDQLSQEGWNHVLLLTPTQLFRNYSAELMRRYQLSDVHDCSVSELYRALLNEYDPRFKNRQYDYELSEEYLPDQYLQEVYDPENIESINLEIEHAIARYVSDGCAALEITPPEQIDTEVVEELVGKLDEAIQAFDMREEILQKDTEYVSRRQMLEQKEKSLAAAQKNYERSEQDMEKFSQEEEKFQNLRNNLQEAQQERTTWLQQRGQHIAEAREKLAQYAKQMDEDYRLDLPARYAHQLSVLEDMINGKRGQSDAEYAQFLEKYCADAEQELLDFTKGQTDEKASRKFAKRREELEDRCRKYSEEVQQLSEEVESGMQWLKQRASEVEGRKTTNAIRRTNMDHARYFLSRIESTVFEREVWNKLAPIKTKYQIKTLHIEEGRDGHQKESRILYKSDLLFYVKIYARLHPAAKLPDYRMLCIDEGQDLHKADYDLLHTLYPDAVYNIFGDTEQVLHTACGISDWRKETGIDTVYSLNRNYRNTAAIVDFCNTELKSRMDYVGRVQLTQKPEIIRSHDELARVLRQNEITVIVKNYAMFERLCQMAGKSKDDFEYLDTHTGSTTETKLSCYSIFAAKGLEFKSVLVYAEEMTKNQRVVACTRAMGRLYYYG